MILRFNGLPVVLESPLQPLARIRVLEISMASMILDSLTKQRSVAAEGGTIGVFEGGITPFTIRQIGSNIVVLRRRIGLVEECSVAGLMRRKIFDKSTILGRCTIVLV
jgi:hypothetical protein